MKTKTIHLENFLSHTDTKHFVGNQGITLIAGQNGVGKSAFLPDGFCFGYFGVTIRGVSGKSIVNRSAGKCCRVTITGESLSGKAFTLVRTIEFPGQPSLSLTYDGELTMVGVKEVQKIIDSEIIGMSYKTFITACVFGKGNSKFFTQLSDADKKAMLDEFMDCYGEISMARINEAHEKAKEALAKHEKEIASLTTQGEMLRTAAKVEINAVRTFYQELRKAEREQKANEAAIKVQLVKLTLDYDTLDSQRQILVAQIQEGKAKAEGQREKQEIASIAHGKERDKWAEIKGYVSNAQTALTALIKRIRDGEFLQEACEKCGQGITETYKEKFINGLLVDKKLLEVQVHTALGVLQAQAEKVELFKGVCADIVASIADLQTNIVNHTRTLNLVESKLYATEAALTTAKQDLQKQEHRSSYFLPGAIKGMLAQAEARLISLQKEEEETLALLRTVECDYANTGIIKKAYSNVGIKSLILDSILPRLNERAEYYSLLLTNGSLLVIFDTQKTNKDGSSKESFDVRVVINEDEVEYISCSDGQRRRIDIITTLALGDVAASIAKNNDVVILDEVFDGLDQEGIGNVLSLLQTLTERFSSIYIVTHDESLSSKFENVITVTNHNNASQLNY